MGLDLKKLSASVKIYGEKLYVEESNAGTVGAGEYELINDNTLKISIGGGKFICARIQQSVLDAGIDFATKVFTIAEFVAMRDASGTTDNGDWSVSKGAHKLFAY